MTGDRMPQEQHSRLTDFAEWLRRRRLAPDNRIPYLVRWVERFLRLSASRPSEAWQDTLRYFLQGLEQGQALDWQIRQAGEAVSLFFGQFRPPSVAPAGRPQKTDAAPCDPAAALNEMERLLRLRHYSPRTQRSYLGWASRYLRYVGGNGSTLPTPDDAKAFLSYLATRRRVSLRPQNQAFHALLFLYRNVYRMELGDMGRLCGRGAGRNFRLCSQPRRFEPYSPS
jgi:hypothetical protein